MIVQNEWGRNYDTPGLVSLYGPMPLNLSDTITKFTASYKVDDDTLVYFTQSEGYRPGGYNRGGGLVNSCASKDPSDEGYCGEGAGENFRANVSTTFESDEVLNTELGIKTVLDDGSNEA